MRHPRSSASAFSAGDRGQHWLWLHGRAEPSTSMVGIVCSDPRIRDYSFQQAPRSFIWIKQIRPLSRNPTSVHQPMMEHRRQSSSSCSNRCKEVHATRQVSRMSCRKSVTAGLNPLLPSRRYMQHATSPISRVKHGRLNLSVAEVRRHNGYRRRVRYQVHATCPGMHRSWYFHRLPRSASLRFCTRSVRTSWNCFFKDGCRSRSSCVCSRCQTPITYRSRNASCARWRAEAEHYKPMSRFTAGRGGKTLGTPLSGCYISPDQVQPAGPL